MQKETAISSTTLDPEEIARFSAIADEWWDPTGKFRPLHLISPARLSFLRREICRHFSRDEKAPSALNGLTLIDIGCGGGLVAEPMAKQGAAVTGIDPAINNISAAKLHAKDENIEIDYRACLAEDIVSNDETFDIVLVLEVVEHVPSVEDFMALVTKLVAPNGLMIVSTINRTTKSFALAIVGAEYILRWLPKGTHQWERFVTPDELKSTAVSAGLQPRDLTGLVFNPFQQSWSISTDCEVNYFMTASRT